jgi:DNA helicase-2/ATP-dependent DNA helicase PcrA
MAILYRTNAQSRALEDRLLMHRIPYVIVGGISFYQRREIKDILSLLRLVQSGNDLAAFVRTINVPKRGIGETTIEKIRIAASETGHSLIGYCSDLVYGKPLNNTVRLSSKQKEALKSYVDLIHHLKEISKSTDLKGLVTAAIEQSGYISYLQEDKESYNDRRENLNALIAKAVDWETSVEEPSLSAFLEELSLKSSLDEADTSQDCLRLMTLHNGKGLEFDVVFVVGMEEDLLPHANSRDNPTAQEEERRLCYVGMTRAKEHLYLSDVRCRYLWGASRTQRPSRFLYDIPLKYIDKIRPTFSARPQAAKPQMAFEDDFIDDIDQRVPEEEDVIQPDDKVLHQQFGIGVVRQVYEGS